MTYGIDMSNKRDHPLNNTNKSSYL